MSVTIETDLKEVLEKLDQKLDKQFEQLEQKLDRRFEQVDKRFEQIDKRFEQVDINLTNLKIGQVEISGRIDTLDERLGGKINALDTKVDGLGSRLSNIEFITRSIFVGLILVVLGGAVKMFGFIAT